MISRIIHINNWDVNVFVCISHYDEKVLEDALYEVDAPISIIVRMRQISRDDEYNTGFTYSNPDLRKSVVVIGKAISGKEFLNTFIHETRHLVDDIANADGMSLRGEDVAYLSGEISSKLYDLVGMFACPKCKRLNNHIKLSLL